MKLGYTVLDYVTVCLKINRIEFMNFNFNL